jgi:hypothetical protein
MLTYICNSEATDRYAGAETAHLGGPAAMGSANQRLLHAV